MTDGVRVLNRQREHFARVPHRLIDSDAPGEAIALYTALARVANFVTGKTDFEDPTTARLMELARIGRRDRFNRARDWLAEHGYLLFSEGRGRPCEYEIGDGDPCAIAHTTPARPAQGLADHSSISTRDLETSSARGAAEKPERVIADRVVRTHWDRCIAARLPTPTVRSASDRPGSRGTPYIGLVKIVETFVVAGHTEQALADALWSTHTFTIAAITLQLRRQSSRDADPVAEWMAREPLALGAHA